MSGIKFIIVVALLGIVASLGKALFHMSSGPEHSEQFLRALTVRISLSVALFLFLMLGWHFGLITPNGAR